MPLQTKIQPPQGVRRPLGGAQSVPMAVSPSVAPSPPVAAPPPRATAAAAPPPVQAAKIEKEKPMSPLDGLSTETVDLISRAYSSGVQVEVIMDTYRVGVEQLDFIVKKYPGLGASREQVLRTRAPLTSIPTAVAAAKVAAPAASPARGPRAQAESPAKAEPTVEPPVPTEADLRGSDEELAEQIRQHVASGWDSNAVAQKFGVAVEFVDELCAPEETEDAATPVPLYAALSQRILDAAWAMLTGAGGPPASVADVVRTLGIDEPTVLSIVEYIEQQQQAEQQAEQQETPAAQVEEPVSSVQVVEPEAPAAPRRLVKADRQKISEGLAAGRTVAELSLELNLREDSVERVRREIESAQAAVEASQEVQRVVQGREPEPEPAPQYPRPTFEEPVVENLPENLPEAPAFSISPRDIAAIFTVLGAFAHSRTPEDVQAGLRGLVPALDLLATIEEETGLTARQIRTLLEWSGLAGN